MYLINLIKKLSPLGKVLLVLFSTFWICGPALHSNIKPDDWIGIFCLLFLYIAVAAYLIMLDIACFEGESWSETKKEVT